MSTLPNEMPYRREAGVCEPCGAESAQLRRITLAESKGSYGHYKCARTVYACEAHDDAGGPVHKAPYREMAPGTSTKHPQKERLL